MPVYERFEDMPVWKSAENLIVETYRITKDAKFRRDYGLVDQIRRASISISGNIAEGFERGLKREFVQFPYIAKGSPGEVRSQLQVSSGLGYINEESFSVLLDQVYDLSKQLGAFISSLRKKV
ncbi:MAG: four helix bundle protein [Candidatus Zixiibacteriota bacterium]|nr:MAG: four helix bundle protein [candidate division Zixibacteria bacterium]